MERELIALKATVEFGFASSNQRIDDFREQHDARIDQIEQVQTERHAENRRHLERIEEKQDKTNGNVVRHDEQIKTLFRRLIGRDGGARPSDFDGTSVTIASLKWYLVCAGGGSGLTLWLLKMIGKL